MPRKAARLSETAPAEAAFISTLISRQEAFGETDADFAAGLEISVALWRATRSGRRALGMKLLVAGAELVSHSVFAAAQTSIMARARTSYPRRDAA